MSDIDQALRALRQMDQAAARQRRWAQACMEAMRPQIEAQLRDGQPLEVAAPPVSTMLRPRTQSGRG